MPITKKEVTKRLNISNLDGRWSGLNAEQKAEAKFNIGNLIVDKINEFLDQSKSPVSNGKFKKSLKKGGASHLFEEGFMRDALEFKPYTQGIDIGIFKADQAIKAFAHNTGFRGHPFIPKNRYVREFIPNKKGKFKKEITTGAREIISKLLGSTGGI